MSSLDGRSRRLTARGKAKSAVDAVTARLTVPVRPRPEATIAPLVFVGV